MKRTKSRTLAPQGTTLQPQSAQSQSLLVPTTNGNEYSGYDGYGSTQDGGSSDEELDPMLNPPIWLFILGGIELAWGSISNGFQVFTSITGILGWQEHELIDAYGYVKAAQLMVERNLGLLIVAMVLGLGAQIGIQAFSQQISKTWRQKRVVEHESTQQALIEIASNLSLGQLLGYVSILVCAFSDYLFVTQIDSSGSLGSYILMTFWAMILACSSTYILMDGWQRVWSGILALRAWRLWQDALKAHFEELARQYQQ